ncbi:MAG TPA: SGNH/GDSL hydrolase family protein [Rhodopila sp.]|nr:SGNH/GDSL hydrolase family protein [Rhodopila sp.]
MAQSSPLPPFGAIYAFGDSLSDAGNLSITTGATGATEPVSPPYFQEKYAPTNGNVFSNGPTWTQDLSIALGLGTLKPSLIGGTDFAYGGAETGSAPQNANEPKLAAISLPAQLVQFQAAVPKPSANALYAVSVGNDDLLDILSKPSLSAAQQAADVSASVTNEINFINSLIKGGATNLLVLNVPDLGKTPDVMTGAVNGSNTPSAALVAEASQLSAQYDTALITQLAAIAKAGAINVNVVDANGLLNHAIADPAAFGLTNVTTPVWSGNFTDPHSGTLAAIGAAAQNQYLYWDILHPTEAGHQALSDLGLQGLTGSPPLIVVNTTTGQSLDAHGQVYTGPVLGPLEQYVNITQDNLYIAVSSPNWFINAGSGTNALAVSSGTNVLATVGSAFLTGGTGTDTFYVDARSAGAASWSTIANFHAGDSLTLWGVTPGDFTLSYLNGQGATGYTGLTVVADSTARPAVAVTLAGFTSSDLADGRLSVAAGNGYTAIRDVA